MAQKAGHPGPECSSRCTGWPMQLVSSPWKCCCCSRWQVPFRKVSSGGAKGCNEAASATDYLSATGQAFLHAANHAENP
eukprot:4881826-Amphidinium_carterae.1